MSSKSSRVTHPDAPLGPVWHWLDHFLSRDTSWMSLLQPALQIIYRYPLTHLGMVTSRGVSLSQQKQRAPTTTVVSPHTQWLINSPSKQIKQKQTHEQRQHRGHHRGVGLLKDIQRNPVKKTGVHTERAIKHKVRWVVSDYLIIRLNKAVGRCERQ